MLKDIRIEKFADVLVNYSLKVKKGENVLISADIEAKPLVLEVYKKLITLGAGEVRVSFSSYEFEEIFFKNASNSQIENFPKIANYEMRNVDCFLAIRATTNSKSLSSVNPDLISKRMATTRPITNYRTENVRWLVTRYPTEAQAQDADMSLGEYEDFVFSSVTDTKWDDLFKFQEQLRKLMDKTRKVKIVGSGTDISFSIKGRKAENAHGTHNMPCGEVFTSVVEDSTNGHITYDFPAIYMGKEFENVRLEFKNGKVVKATASKGEKDLNKILDMDKGARIIGEFGIGNNFKIKRFTKSILFDEKIGGSVHLALGRGYKKTLSKNNSSLHWDMIKDLRTKGKLFFDDKLVQEKGKWKI